MARNALHSAPRSLAVPGRRLVVVDCETNGLYGDVRILSLAVVELRRGLAYNSGLWLMNPGNVYMEPGAIAVNGLTAELLEDAQSFSDHAEEITAWLTPAPGERLTLVGHKVNFDARQLLGEFARLGRPLPEIDLLDTARLAEAAKVIPPNRSLAGLLDVLGLSNTAPHTALSDALATAAAAVDLMSRIAADPATSSLANAIDSLCVPFELERATTAQPHVVSPSDLSDAHLAAHLADLSDGRRRRAALDVCLTEDCELLASRMEDGIITTAHARQVVSWAFEHLNADKLGRSTQGRLLRGVGQALRRAENAGFAADTHRSLLGPYVDAAGRCTKRRSCERCAAGFGVCDFVNVLRRCVDAYINVHFDPFKHTTSKQVEAYLPGYNPAVSRGRGRPAQGFYGELIRAGHYDAAGYGVASVAQIRRVEGGRDWAYALLAKGWNDGCCTPRLTEMLASMTVVDAIGEIDDDGELDPKAPIVAAIAYIDICVKAYPGQNGAVFDRLAKRRERLVRLKDAAPRPERDLTKAINLRPAHPQGLGQAPKIGRVGTKQARRVPSMAVPAPAVFPSKRRRVN